MVYIVSAKLPMVETYGLTSQMRRAAVSVVSNIAEGSGRATKKDQAYFYQVAYSSLIELLNQLIIANDLEYITIENLKNLRSDIEIISGKLNALRRSRLE